MTTWANCYITPRMTISLWVHLSNNTLNYLPRVISTGTSLCFLKSSVTNLCWHLLMFSVLVYSSRIRTCFYQCLQLARIIYETDMRVWCGFMPHHYSNNKAHNKKDAHYSSIAHWRGPRQNAPYRAIYLMRFPTALSIDSHLKPPTVYSCKNM